MSAFCGSCGTPRQAGARFCMNCGGAFPEDRFCPTCKQTWPQGVPWSDEASLIAQQAPRQQEADLDLAVSWQAGLYFAGERRVHFDGAEWRGTELRQGQHVPVSHEVLAGFDPEAEGAVLLRVDDSEGVRLRAPNPGPDYVPNIDCGNCGYPIGSPGDACSVCGTTNVGPKFNPASLNLE